MNAMRSRGTVREVSVVAEPPIGGGGGGDGGGNGDNGDDGSNPSDGNLIAGFIPPLEDVSPEGVIQYAQDNPLIVSGGLVGTAFVVSAIRNRGSGSRSLGGRVISPVTAPYRRTGRGN